MPKTVACRRGANYNGAVFGSVIQFALAAGTIVVAAVFLTRFADRIAEDTNLGRLFVGTILLAGATSLPELLVDLNAVAKGHVDLATGDLLGSSLFNLLILSLLDAVFRPDCRVFSPGARAFVPLGMLSVVVTVLVGAGIATGSEVAFLGIGPFVWLTFAAYVIGLRFVVAPEAAAAARPISSTTSGLQRRRLLNSGAGYLGSTVVLVTAAPYLVAAADQIARETGAGQGIIGTVLVAFSTSLPELVATLAAMRMNAPALAIGNIFGSNAFNMALFFPLDAMYHGNLLHDVRAMHIATAGYVVALTSLGVLGQRGVAPRLGVKAELIGLAVLAALVSLYYLRML